MGHRDGPTDNQLSRTHGRRDVALALARLQDVRVGRVRRVRQAMGHTRGSLQANLSWPRVRYQRSHGNYYVQLTLFTQHNKSHQMCALVCVCVFVFLVLPERLRVRNGLGRRHVPLVRHTRRPGDRHVLT